MKIGASGKREMTQREVQYEAESHIHVGEDKLLQRLREEFSHPRHDAEPPVERSRTRIRGA